MSRGLRRTVRRRERRHGPISAGHASTERWLVSYADFITLLFAFFTTMYAISSVDARKLSVMVESLASAFASDSAGSGGHSAQTAAAVIGDEAGKLDVVLTGPQRLHDIETDIRARLREAIASQQLDIEVVRRGLVISIREAGAFPIGSADLPDKTAGLLGQIGRTLAGVDNEVRVEGHTDDTPIHTARFASNWDLSTARATTVVAYFVERAGVAPTRIAAAGYGEFRPRQPNTSDVNRAHNRRVDIVVLNKDADAPEVPSPSCR